MKTCFKCLCTKPLTEFYRHSEMGDGHLGKCKDCTKTDVKEHRQRESERVRAYDRMRASQPKRVAKAKEIQKDYRARFPERRAATSKVNHAIQTGKMTPLPCFVCGDKAEGHHPDYSRPLDVVWLCPSHHKLAHALAGALDASHQRNAR